MSPARYPRALRAAGAAGLFTVLALVIFGGTAGALGAAGDTIITVTVSPAPQPIDTPATDSESASGGFSSSASPGESPSGPTGASSASAPKPLPGETSVGGVLFISGLTMQYVWSSNPLGSAVKVGYTVRNVSKTTFDSTGRFWVEGPLGNRLDASGPIDVGTLKPGHSRRVEATLGDLSQWTGYHLYGSLTPPKTVDGKALRTVTRDAFIVLPPFLVGGLGLAAIAVYVCLRFVFYRKPVELAGEPA